MSKRMLHTKFFDSESVAELTIRQRYLVLGIITIADDQGRLKANPRWLRSKIFPYDEISAQDIKEDIQAIALANDTIQCYQVDGKQYIQLINWWEYQSPQWAKKSEYPTPEGWEDRIREMKYKPVRWVYTSNWEGSEDNMEYQVIPLGNKPANNTSNALPIFNINTIINSKVKPLTIEGKENLIDFMLAYWRKNFPKKVQPKPATYTKKISTRIKDADFINSWVKAVDRASRSPHLNNEHWFSFEYTVRNNENICKVLDGVFDSFDNQLTRKTGKVQNLPEGV